MGLIEFSSITKHFGGTLALDGVSLSIGRGECHALMGENGAGKSTLGKILAGIHRPDAGTLLLDGTPRDFRSPADSRAAGIGIVHQELAFCPDLPVAENLLLGELPRRLGFFVDHAGLLRKARTLLEPIAPGIDPSAPMRDLSIAHRQLVQIAGAVGTGAAVLIFDEPTSSLGEAESQQLFALIRRLRSRGVTIIYISHRMPEVLDLADRISVLRDGRLAGSVSRAEAGEQDLIGMMIGRELPAQAAPPPEASAGGELLSVSALTSPGKFENVGFRLREGEVLGMAGLVGSGRSEVARALFGLDAGARGAVVLAGRDLSGASTRERMDAGMALVPEDRKGQGLALDLSCRWNFSLTILQKIKRMLFLSRPKEDAFLGKFFGALRIKASSFDADASSLSGGNQQKLVLAKWLAREARMLILDEPTRGVDVGAKSAIQSLIISLARQGLGVLLISSELPELLALSDRILVMRGGALAGEVRREQASQEILLKLMSGL